MNKPTNMTRLEVVNVETLEVTKAVYLAGHNAQEIQKMSDSLLRNLNTFQFFVRATPSAAPVAPVADDRHPWFCAHCQTGVPNVNVTFEEQHDPRAGGCGYRVGDWPERELSSPAAAQKAV